MKIIDFNGINMNWYIQDLDCYNEKFLKWIIADLYDKLNDKDKDTTPEQDAPNSQNLSPDYSEEGDASGERLPSPDTDEQQIKKEIDKDYALVKGDEDE